MTSTRNATSRPGLAFLMALAALLVPCLTLAEEEPMVVGEIVITGNDKTDGLLIERVMDLRVGDSFDLDRMDDAWDALEDCGYFRFVEMDFDDEDPAAVIVTVLVEEDMHTFFGPLIRYSRRDKYFLGGWIEERNFRGKGETLRAELSVIYAQEGVISWKRPWLFGVEGLEGTVAVTGKNAKQFVFRPTRYRKGDGGLDLNWNFTGHFFVSAAAAYGTFNQRDAYSYAAPDRGSDTVPGNIYYPDRVYEHMVYDGAVGFDSRSNPYYPLRGYYFKLEGRHWQSEQFDPYNQVSLDARLFIPLPWQKHILALHGWGRQTDGPTQLDNALYFGGVETIRGSQFGTREGDEGYLLSAEYRIPLFLMPISPTGELVGFGLHGFFDAGDAWYHGAEAGRNMVGYGGGAHINLDTWQLRFEAARDRDGGWRFEFNDRFNF